MARARDSSVSIVAVQPVVDTSAYATGDFIGADVLTFPDLALQLTESVGQRGGLIQSIMVVDKASQDANLEIIIFSSDPAATTFSDNDALDIDDADLAKIIAIIPITAYHDFVDNSVATVSGLAIPFITDTGNDLFVAIVSRGAPTYVATSDVIITIGVVNG